MSASGLAGALDREHEARKQASDLRALRRWRWETLAGPQCPACYLGRASWPDDAENPVCSAGCSSDEIDAALQDLERAASEPEPTDAEIERHREKLELLDLALLAATTPEPVPWVVDRIAMSGGLTLLAGIAGQGKSLVCMAWAIAATRRGGATVAGMKVEPGHVLILDAENGPREIHRRVHALGLDSQAVDRMSIVSADGFDLRRDLDELDELLAKHEPDLVILDSWRSLWRGDERDEAEVSGVLDPLRNLIRRYDAATILIHHARRDGSGYRGSGAIAASCELVYLLGRPQELEDRQLRRLSCEKSRPAAEPPPRWLRLASEAELLLGAPLLAQADKPTATIDKTPARSAIKAMALEILRGGPLSRAAVCRQLSKAKDDSTVRRAFDELEAAGEIARNTAGLWGVVNLSTPDHPADHGGVVVTYGVGVDHLTTPEDGDR